MAAAPRYQVTEPGGRKLGRANTNPVIVAQQCVDHIKANPTARLFITADRDTLTVRAPDPDGLFTWVEHGTAPWFGQMQDLISRFWRTT